MGSSYFFSVVENTTSTNASSINSLRTYAEKLGKLVYVLDRPLTDNKYTYDFKDALIVLSPGRKIAVLNLSKNTDQFDAFVEDVIEDISSISDKYNYKEVLGRPRVWRKMVEVNISSDDLLDAESFFSKLDLTDEKDKKHIELLISLFIGSINDMDRVKDTVPTTLLDRVKQKIQLFDGDQTRFIYQKPSSKRVTIQGLSGTGKTELLLHKLKDVYISEPDSKIYFTCWNKILADSLRNRIPDFFNFMKVEQQIKWAERLWCTNSWGSERSPNSGAYSLICAYLKVPFHPWSYQMSFSNACALTLKEVKARYVQAGSIKPLFTYMFIDESQDFDENFFELCEMVTEKNIYIAGDIFQSIFDERISNVITPDFLLGKCYRTDPRTLMFAHALGMGLFEKQKLRWLEVKEWEDCGYQVRVDEQRIFHLSREPIRRFEDVKDDFQSIEIVATKKSFADEIIEVINALKKSHSTVSASDVGIILLDANKQIYQFADQLEYLIQTKIGWKVNKAYETKERVDNSVLISNRNNVKGLEFPFVICVTGKIVNGSSYRNSIYTMLTRSFIKSYFVIPEGSNSGLTDEMKTGLAEIVMQKEMSIAEPSDEEKAKINTKFKYETKHLSHYDLMMLIFTTLNTPEKYHDKLLAATQKLEMTEADAETLTEFVKDTLKYIEN